MYYSLHCLLMFRLFGAVIKLMTTLFVGQPRIHQVCQEAGSLLQVEQINSFETGTLHQCSILFHLDILRSGELSVLSGKTNIFSLVSFIF